MNDFPREPMPKSYKPVWIFMGYMVLIMIVMGVIAAVIAKMVQSG